jgi:molybdate transport system ATP-binding protein
MSTSTEAFKVKLSQAGPIPLDAEFECATGELLALIGPSGAGKTTILRAISGLYRPLTGRISCGGEVWFDSVAGLMLPPQSRSVGLVFQDYALFPHLSALDNVRLAMRHVPEPERTAAARQLLARVHLDGFNSRRPGGLSGGERQRVAIARALARGPKVLLLDEPFSAVDRMTREPLKEELLALRRSLKIPIILVTHDLGEAQALADRMCVIERGKVAQCGSPEQLRLKPASPGVALMMGQSNVIDAVVEQPAISGGVTRVRSAGGPLVVDGSVPFARGEAVSVLLPSEFLAFADAGARENVLKGTIAEIRAQGDISMIFVRLDQPGGPLIRLTLASRERNERVLAQGQPLRLHISPAHIHLMPR